MWPVILQRKLTMAPGPAPCLACSSRHFQVSYDVWCWSRSAVSKHTESPTKNAKRLVGREAGDRICGRTWPATVNTQTSSQPCLICNRDGRDSRQGSPRKRIGDARRVSSAPNCRGPAAHHEGLLRHIDLAHALHALLAGGLLLQQLLLPAIARDQQQCRSQSCGTHDASFLHSPSRSSSSKHRTTRFRNIHAAHTASSCSWCVSPAPQQQQRKPPQWLRTG